MKIPIRGFPDEGMELDVREEPLWSSRGLTRGPISSHLHVDRSGGSFVVWGTASAELTLRCDRCLEWYPYPVEVEVRATLVPAGEGDREPPENLELTEEDLDVTLFEGEEIDLTPIVEDHIALAVPLKTLCRTDCAGICPYCGANRNVDPCSCRKQRLENPFSALKKMRFKENAGKTGE